MRRWWSDVRADLRRNRANPKGALVLLAYRTAHHARGRARRPRWWSWPLLVTYRVLVEWVLGIELPAATVAGPGLGLFHGQALVVHSNAVLGAGVVLRHSTTIGVTTDEVGGDSDPPTIGDRVSIGPGAIILGPVHVGDDAVIGVGAVVLEDVPERAIVAGNPARVLRIRPVEGAA